MCCRRGALKDVRPLLSSPHQREELEIHTPPTSQVTAGPDIDQKKQTQRSWRRCENVVWRFDEKLSSSGSLIIVMFSYAVIFTIWRNLWGSWTFTVWSPSLCIHVSELPGHNGGLIIYWEVFCTSILSWRTTSLRCDVWIELQTQVSQHKHF